MCNYADKTDQPTNKQWDTSKIITSVTQVNMASTDLVIKML